MAMNDVTYIGFTPAAVDSQFVDLSSNRQTGDTNNQNKINTQLIDMDAQNKDIEDRTTESLVLLNSQINQLATARENSLGDGINLTSSINSVATYYNDKQSVFAGLETTSSLNTKSDTIDSKVVLMEPKLDDLSSNVDPNSFKELYDNIMANVDVNDPTTVAGFEYSMRKSISKLADNGDQKKGGCLIYKDENTKSFYEMYIYNGLIALEEVPNPDKDVILSYLTNTNVPKPNNVVIQGYMMNTVVPLNSEYFVVFYYNLNAPTITVKASLFYINPTTKAISVTTGFATKEFTSSSAILDFKFYKHDVNNIIVVARNDIGTYNLENSSLLHIDFDDHINTNFSTRPQGGNDFLAHHGMYNNGSTALVISKNSNMVVISNPITHIVSASFSLPATYSMATLSTFGNYDTSSVIADSQHVYILAKTPYGVMSVFKYLLSDQSLVSELVLTDYVLRSGQNFGFTFIGGKLAVVGIKNIAEQLMYLLFINQDNMTLYPDSDINWAPILLGKYLDDRPTVRDLGNGKILIRSYVTNYIYTYDGYQIYASSGDHGIINIDALNENILYYTHTDGNYTTVSSNPIYKYK